MKLLRFTASWCGPCKSLASNLDKIDIKLPIEVIDIDVFPDVAKDYGVRGVPTLIKVKDGQEIDRYVGVKTLEDLSSWLNK